MTDGAYALLIYVPILIWLLIRSYHVGLTGALKEADTGLRRLFDRILYGKGTCLILHKIADQEMAMYGEVRWTDSRDHLERCGRYPELKGRSVKKRPELKLPDPGKGVAPRKSVKPPRPPRGPGGVSKAKNPLVPSTVVSTKAVNVADNSRPGGTSRCLHKWDFTGVDKFGYYMFVCFKCRTTVAVSEPGIDCSHEETMVEISRTFDGSIQYGCGKCGTGVHIPFRPPATSRETKT